MGAPAMVGNKSRKSPEWLMEKYGMKMDHNMDSEMNMDADEPKSMNHEMDIKEMSATNVMDTRHNSFDYNLLKAKETTNFKSNLDVNELPFNLTGNMNRYVWSINAIPISETDKVKIKSGELTRIKLNNLTMMHHPMHLHGHYFRVKKNGERSPLKHIVNVPPTQKNHH